jgi:flagellar basal body-associated protein FliL
MNFSFGPAVIAVVVGIVALAAAGAVIWFVLSSGNKDD